MFCATPEYLRSRGTPEDPRDLHKHTLGLYSGLPDARPLDLPPRGRADHALHERALPDQRASCCASTRWSTPASSDLPTLVAGDAILRGDLQVVLAEHQLSSFSLNAV